MATITHYPLPITYQAAGSRQQAAGPLESAPARLFPRGLTGGSFPSMPQRHLAMRSWPQREKPRDCMLHALYEECSKDRDVFSRVFVGGGLSGEPWFAPSLQKFHHPEHEPGRVP